MELDLDHLKSWIGKTRESDDAVTPRLANSLAAVLDEAPDLTIGAPAPAGIHWCLSPDIVPMAGLGPDGHPMRGDFLPPVSLPRRMWAGGELIIRSAFRVGDPVQRKSRIADVAVKSGRSGPLCFVAVNHDYHTPRGLALQERHDIVYRSLEATRASAPPPPPSDGEVMQRIEASPVLLARYSAVTFNGHRIHYDRTYCEVDEGYPGLLVHGPLQATYMLREAARVIADCPAWRFTYRARAPLFDGGCLTVNRSAGPDCRQFWIASPTGAITMEAEASALSPA